MKLDSDHFGNPLSESGKLELLDKEETKPVKQTKHSHYYKDVTHLAVVDVYRLLDLFDTGSSSIDHAIKKLLVAGERGTKNRRKDLNEAIDSIQRALDMMDEDGIQ